MANLLDRARDGLTKRGTTSFLIAAVVLGVLVGLATAGLALLIDVVESVTRSFGDWTNWGVLAFAITIPVGMSISW